MSENEFIRHLLDRPALYLPRQSADCLVAYLWGYLAAQQIAPTGLLDNLLAKTRDRLVDGQQPTSHGLVDLVGMYCQGDETRMFEYLISAFRRELGFPNTAAD